MAKLTAWLVTLAGVLLVLAAAGMIDVVNGVWAWVLAIVVLAIGVGKLVRNYSTQKRK